MRRVVVTGMGMVSPLGHGVDVNWNNLMNKVSGIRKIERFDASGLSAKIAGLIPFGDNDGEFNPDKQIQPRDQRRMDPFIVYGLCAGFDAVEDSGWTATTETDKDRTGVLIGSGIGGLSTIYNTSIQLHDNGQRKVSPFFIPSCLINLISGNLSIKYGFRGPNHSVVTACATGTHAIGDAARLIQLDLADVMVAGGAEAAVCPLAIAGFSQAKALSTSHNDEPEKASRPWDKHRDGFVMGEGAGVIVLEEYEHALKRGAKIYGEFKGAGLSGDAHHITAPHPEGEGAYLAMRMALKEAHLEPESVDYINAHGTSTLAGDELEVKAVKRVFGEHAHKLSMSSTKSATGHLLGAAGAIEAIYCLKAIEHQTAPATLNLEEPFDGCDIDLVPLEPKKRKIDVAMSNSFGFGGTNSSIIFSKL